VKIEIRCGACGETYLVDEGQLPASSGKLPCVACGATIATPPRARRTPAASDAPSPQPAPKATPTPTEATSEEVVCPRCNLHFVPGRARAAGPSPESRSSERRTILVVEDMDYFLEIASDSLGAKFEVRTAKTLDEARREIATGEIDLMIIDLTLEGGDQGRLLLDELSPKRFPVLVFTAQDESEMYGQRWSELQALGADDLVLKGMNVGEVLLRKSAELLGVELGEEDLP